MEDCTRQCSKVSSWSEVTANSEFWNCINKGGFLQEISLLKTPHCYTRRSEVSVSRRLAGWSHSSGAGHLSGAEQHILNILLHYMVLTPKVSSLFSGSLSFWETDRKWNRPYPGSTTAQVIQHLNKCELFIFRQGTGHYLILKESTEKQDFNIPVFFNVHVTINNARAMKKKRQKWIS